MSRRVAPRRAVKAGRAGAGAEASPNRALSGAEQTRNRVSYPWPGRGPANPGWRAEPVSGSKLREELWVGVKCQPNAEIAGSPRNAFGGSPDHDGRAGVGRWMGQGARACRTQPNREYRAAESGVRARGLSSAPERGTTRTAS